jgi:hypothetical protein
LQVSYISKYVEGVGIKREMIIHTAWTPEKSESWGFFVSPQLSRCLMTASRASEKTGCSNGYFYGSRFKIYMSKRKSFRIFLL